MNRKTVQGFHLDLPHTLLQRFFGPSRTLAQAWKTCAEPRLQLELLAEAFRIGESIGAPIPASGLLHLLIDLAEAQVPDAIHRESGPVYTEIRDIFQACRVTANTARTPKDHEQPLFPSYDGADLGHRHEWEAILLCDALNTFAELVLEHRRCHTGEQLRRQRMVAEIGRFTKAFDLLTRLLNDPDERLVSASRTLCESQAIEGKPLLEWITQLLSHASRTGNHRLHANILPYEGKMIEYLRLFDKSSGRFLGIWIHNQGFRGSGATPLREIAIGPLLASGEAPYDLTCDRPLVATSHLQENGKRPSSADAILERLSSEPC